MLVLICSVWDVTLHHFFIAFLNIVLYLYYRLFIFFYILSCFCFIFIYLFLLSFCLGLRPIWTQPILQAQPLLIQAQQQDSFPGPHGSIACLFFCMHGLSAWCPCSNVQTQRTFISTCEAHQRCQSILTLYTQKQQLQSGSVTSLVWHQPSNRLFSISARRNRPQQHRPLHAPAVIYASLHRSISSSLSSVFSARWTSSPAQQLPAMHDQQLKKASSTCQLGTWNSLPRWL